MDDLKGDLRPLDRAVASVSLVASMAERGRRTPYSELHAIRANLADAKANAQKSADPKTDLVARIERLAGVAEFLLRKVENEDRGIAAASRAVFEARQELAHVRPYDPAVDRQEIRETLAEATNLKRRLVADEAAATGDLNTAVLLRSTKR